MTPTGKASRHHSPEMGRLIEETPRNREVIFPYIGGKEVNSSPTHDHHRYVINFRDWPLRRADLGATWQDADGQQRRDWCRDGIVPLDYPEPVAADSPELLAIVEEKVKPERLAQNDKGREAEVVAVHPPPPRATRRYRRPGTSVGNSADLKRAGLCPYAAEHGLGSNTDRLPVLRLRYLRRA